MSYDALCLSGGGLKGVHLLGSLQYLYDNNMLSNVKSYFGTSMGSIISYFLIIGYTPVELLVYICINTSVFEKLKTIDLISMSRREGALSYIPILEELEKMTLEKAGRLFTMSELYQTYNKKLTCITYNETKGQMEILSQDLTPDLPCLDALRMSSNLPLVFASYNYNDNFYIDGGITNNFPLEIAEEMGERVIGLCLQNERRDAVNILEYVYNLLFVPMEHDFKRKISQKRENTSVLPIKCDNRVKMFNFDISSKLKLDMFSYGYEQAKILN